MAFSSYRDANRRAHRRTNGDALHVLAFDRLRFQVQHKIDKGFDVVLERWRVEAHLADDSVYDAAVVVAELHLAGLVLLHDAAYIGRYRTGAGRRHQPARTEHLAQWTDQAHHVRSSDAHVKLRPAVLDLLCQIFLTDDIGSRGFRHFGHVSLGKHCHALRAADAVRQHDRPADDLVGLFWIDAQPHVNLDRLVELRVAE